MTESALGLVVYVDQDSVNCLRMEPVVESLVGKHRLLGQYQDASSLGLPGEHLPLIILHKPDGKAVGRSMGAKTLVQLEDALGLS